MAPACARVGVAALLVLAAPLLAGSGAWAATLEEGQASIQRGVAYWETVCARVQRSRGPPCYGQMQSRPHTHTKAP